MNVQEMLALLQIFSAILEQVTKLVEMLKGAGVDVSGVKLHTATPIDVGSVLRALVGK